MSEPEQIRLRFPSLPGLLILFALLSFFVSCTSDSQGGSRQIQFTLADSLKNYSKVLITIVDAKDSGRVLDTAFNGKIADPKNFPPYRVPDSIGADFTIRIQGFDDAGLLALQSDIGVKGGTASAPVKTPPEKLPALASALSSARLKNLEVSAGILDPVFNPAHFTYVVDLPFAADSLSVNASANDSLASLTLNGAVVNSGAVSNPQALKIGENVLKLSVLPKGGTLPNIYVLTVRRKAGGEARLDTIRTTAGKFSPAFNPDSLNYTLTAEADVDSLDLLPILKDDKAKIGATGGLLDSAFGLAVALSSGVTSKVTFIVTSPDGSVSKTYTVNVKRAASADAALSSIDIASGTLVPPFDPDLDQYTATVVGDQASLIVKSRQGAAAIALNGAAIPNGESFAPIDLPVGLTPVILSVTAEDGKTKRSYSVTLNRASPDALLQGLSLSGATLDSPFAATRIHYRTSVARIIDNFVLSCETNSGQTLKVTVNGNAVDASGGGAVIGGFKITSFTIPLNVGANAIAVEVTAPDKVSKATYTLDAVRTPNTIATLSELSAAPGTKKPAFDTAITAYTDSVLNFIASVSVTAKAKDTAALVIVRLMRQDFGISKVVLAGHAGLAKAAGLVGTPIFKFRWVTISTDTLRPPASTKSLNLEPGLNRAEVEVIAEDRVTTKFYDMDIYRALSNVSDLNGLVPASGGTPLTLSPVFAPNTPSYSTTTFSGFVTVTPNTIDSNATVTVNGTAVASGSASGSIALQTGSNIITTVSTAADGKTNSVYTVNVTKLNLIFIPVAKAPAKTPE